MASERAIQNTLELVRTEELYSTWLYIHALEQGGLVRAVVARRWKKAIVGAIVERELPLIGRPARGVRRPPRIGLRGVRTPR
jgi:hypothetical protein